MSDQAFKPAPDRGATGPARPGRPIPVPIDPAPDNPPAKPAYPDPETVIPPGENIPQER